MAEVERFERLAPLKAELGTKADMDRKGEGNGGLIWAWTRNDDKMTREGGVGELSSKGLVSSSCRQGKDVGRRRVGKAKITSYEFVLFLSNIRAYDEIKAIFEILLEGLDSMIIGDRKMWRRGATEVKFGRRLFAVGM